MDSDRTKGYRNKKYYPDFISNLHVISDSKILLAWLYFKSKLNCISNIHEIFLRLILLQDSTIYNYKLLTDDLMGSNSQHFPS